MLLLRAPIVAKDKTSNGSKAEKKPKRHLHEQRKELFQPIQVYRELAQWLTDIARDETRVRRKAGQLKGYDQVSVAKIVDPLLRRWAWNKLCEINNRKTGVPNDPIPPVPPAPEEVVEL